MGFPMYPQFPLEIRLQIIEEAVNSCTYEYRAFKTLLAPFVSIIDVEAYIKESGRFNNRLAPWATINSEWNKVVERALFKRIKFHALELQEFANICGKRNALLRQVHYELGPHYLSLLTSTPSEPYEDIVHGISEFFHLMKDWVPAQRPDHLIKLSIGVSTHIVPHPQVILSDSCDFKDLPEVAAIGRVYAQAGALGDFWWSHTTMHTIHKKLPNLRSIRLAMTTHANVQKTIDDTSSMMIASHAVNPNLTKLSIIQNNSRDPFLSHERSDRITIAKSLAPQLSLWRNTLVCLKLNCFIDPSQFLLTASASLWPNLDRVDFEGIMDDDDNLDGRTWANECQACNDLLRGLIACLPNMPRLTTLGIRLSDGAWDCGLSMDLGVGKSKERLVWQPSSSRGYPPPTKRPVRPCCPLATEAGILVAHGTNLPGHLVTELQDSVFRFRQLELAVFRCTELEVVIQEDRGAPPPCGQWSRDTGSWEPAFENGMDEFIFGMGQYFQRLEVWDS